MDTFDVAVRITRTLPSATMVARRIGPVRSVVCASPQYLDQRGRPATPRDLAHHDILGFKFRPAGDSLTFRDARGIQETVRFTTQVHANNGENLRELAIQGLGVIDQPYFAVDRYIEAGQLEPLLPGWTVEDRSIFVLFLSRKFLPAKVRVFIDFLAEMEGHR